MDVAGETIHKIVLAAVRLVGNHNDVATRRKQRVDVAPLVGHELVHRGEDNAARRHTQQLAQMGAVFGLARLLAQKLAAAGKGAEKLVVEVVAVGKDDERGILHGGMQDDAPGIEGHGQALAAALRMPDDADALVARAGRVVVTPCDV